ncbi:glycoside hydrolase family 28 protein [Undibacterium cyanobacteriorum]|uniref:Glycoside hydrolase family 28 protein n=2 Tax=Undibacterium cyanobacteriorum TaxID=3073561 RepID=A0ABY9RMY3_9BURK|nr:glycoside hydrolase family 28 protein [Undibacterium sp. 20NA77.5]WMW82547.1 glycoside hydrolase family 28 protein [Undibacterium sp. 20NA77.5]
MTAAGAAMALPSFAMQTKTDSAQDPWNRAQAIIDRLNQTPRFPEHDFLVTEFGAKTCEVVPVKAWISHEEQAMLSSPIVGSHDCYAAFAAAIQACAKAGGGRVLIPRGDWYCAGPIVLLSNVHVHLQAGAHVYFSHQPEDYAKYGSVDCGGNGRLVISRWQSNDCLNYSPMVYAFGQINVALTGEDWTSILDGQGGVPFNEAGDCWWTWKGKQKTINSVGQDGTPNYKAGKMSENTVNPLNAKALSEVVNIANDEAALIQGEGDRWRADGAYLPALSEARVPLAKRVFGRGHYLRPPMIQLIGCDRVFLQGYQVTNTPFWQHHPVNCRDVVIRKVLAKSHGPNSDGFDPEACDNVLVDACTFDTGDDCIAIKAGKNRDTQYGPSRNIVIQNCTMQSGHGAVTLGSEMAGGIEHVYAQNLLFENRHWATNPLNTAIRLKTNLNRGGYLRHFYVRNVHIPNGVQTSPSFYASLPGSPIASRTVASAAGAVVTFDCDYAPVADNVRIRPPEVRDVYISNVTVGNVRSKTGQNSCYQAIVILGPVASDYNGPQPMPPVLPVRNVVIENCDFGDPVNQAQAMYLYNVKGLQLKNVKIGSKVMTEEFNA